MNKVVQVSRYADDTSGLEIVERPIPQPGPGEVLVRVHLRPVNPADVFMVHGLFAQTLKPPLTPGSEGVGTIASFSERFPVGQRVVAAPFPMFYGEGRWAEYCVVAETALVAVPDSVPDEVASQFFINPVAVYGILDMVQIPPGKYLLQSAAGSAFGRMLIALAKVRGVRTINVVRRAEQIPELLALGADEVIASDSTDLPGRVREITGGEGAHAGIDCVGGETIGLIISALRPGGTILSFGSLSGANVKLQINWMDVVALGKRVESFLVWGWLQEQSLDERQTKLEEVMQLLVDGVLQPAEGVKYPLERVKDAIAAHKEPGRQGKVFLESRGVGLSRLSRASTEEAM